MKKETAPRIRRLRSATHPAAAETADSSAHTEIKVPSHFQPWSEARQLRAYGD